MHRTISRSVGCVFVCVALVACSGTATQRSAPSPVLPAAGIVQQQAAANTPMLVTINSKTDRLEAWPIRRGGGVDPEPISPKIDVNGITGMAAIGDVVAVTTAFPPRVVLYNIKNQTTRFLDDPAGTPVDIAVGKDTSIYVLNITKTGTPVTMYTAPGHKATQLNCSLMTQGAALAVDNEGDIFIQGYPANSIYSVAEIPNGPNGPEPQNCAVVPVETNPGYVAGIKVDPKTDDLVTLDDPSLCAGGEEGRMTIYPKPYNQSTGKSRDIGENCTGGLHLNAESTLVFTTDEDVSGSFTFILQRSFPDGGRMGVYHGSNFTGIATMPNSLPD